MSDVFTIKHHLRLLQLLTLRAMQDRQSRAAKSSGITTDSDENMHAESKPLEIPTKWRLVPENVTLYDWQESCLPIWLSRGRGTVKVATGGGKTLFALAAAERLQNAGERDLRLVVVVPTIPLMFQWYDEIRRGNLPETAIGLMGGGQALAPASGLRVLICVLNSAREHLPAFVAKARWADRMFLVVDECHRASAEQARRVFEARPKYTMGLSATPEQDPEIEGLPTDEGYENSVVGRALGAILYDFTLKQSLDAGLLTPFEVWHVGLSLSSTEASEHARLSREITDLRKSLQIRHRNSRSRQSFLAWCQTQASRNGPAAPEASRFIDLANRRKRLLYRAKARTEIALAILSESTSDPDGRAIVFHESIEEIEGLFLASLEMQIPAVLEHSQLPDSLRAENINAFREGVARAIISAKSLVEGFNVPSANLGIIAASSGSVRQRIQSLGRMLRRKPGARSALIVVLYVRDTEDEAIYEKADWETIVGAERNRYFYWTSSENRPWADGLAEKTRPPRLYKPPSSEVDVTGLRTGDPYPGQPTGVDLRVDQSGNLRTEDGALVSASADVVQRIQERNPYGRARRTPAGHLIVRTDERGSDEADWRFLGTAELPDEPHRAIATRLRLRTSSGKRVIALEDSSKRGLVHFALGPSASRIPASGQARDQLLRWIRDVEAERQIAVKDVFWDNGTGYWLEIGGKKIPYPGELAPLEFAQ